jgi:hypothetical protein
MRNFQWRLEGTEQARRAVSLAEFQMEGSEVRRQVEETIAVASAPVNRVVAAGIPALRVS